MKNANLRLAGNAVYLRDPRIEDFDELAGLYRSSRQHFRGLVGPTLVIETYEKMIADSASNAIEPFLVCRTSDDEIAGTVTLSQIFRRSFQNAYLGYLLGGKFTGNGYMTESVGLILKFAFRQLKLHRIEANVQPGNLPSIGVLVRNGFTKEGFSRRYLKIAGRWRDHERWAIIREDWHKK